MRDNWLDRLGSRLLIRCLPSAIGTDDVARIGTKGNNLDRCTQACQLAETGGGGELFTCSLVLRRFVFIVVT